MSQVRSGLQRLETGKSHIKLVSEGERSSTTSRNSEPSSSLVSCRDVMPVLQQPIWVGWGLVADRNVCKQE